MNYVKIYENTFNILKKIIFDIIMILFIICTFYIFFLYYQSTKNILFTLFLVLISYIILLYNDYKSYIFTIKSIIINSEYSLKFTGYKYLKMTDENLDLKKCKYFLIKITRGSANFDLQINYSGQFLYLSDDNIGEEEVFKIYNILKEKFPENDLGQKWKYIIIGNTW
jgi:hypothetical protein